jgi:hypothetical protein
MADRTDPISVEATWLGNPWFSGLSHVPHAASHIFSVLAGDAVHVISIDDVDYFSEIDQKTWDAIVVAADAMVYDQIDIGSPESACRNVAIRCLPQSAIEFSDSLWGVVRRNFQFASQSDGDEPILCAKGVNTRSLIVAILNESPTPLHYSTINALLEKRTGFRGNARLSLSIASKSCFLLGRGMYGTERHFTYSHETMDRICVVAEEIMSHKGSDHQWHSEEILNKLKEAEPDLTESLTKYTLSISLGRSKNLKYLGRQMWVLDDPQHQIGRINVSTIAESLLESNGKPMSASEIVRQVRDIRGGSRWLQISQTGRLIKVGTGTWGLNDRDIPIKLSDQPAFLDRIVETVKNLDHGINLNNETMRLTFGIPSDIDAEVVLGLIETDSRLVITKGKWLSLRKKTNPRGRRKQNGKAIEA